ncbi:hypothetical protein KJ865_02140, partial [Myxococcota bacterium]|nr:hypothetical protein [Myxococcota bacterium]
NLNAFLNTLKKLKETYQKRFFKLVGVRDSLLNGKAALWPTTCGLQCRAFKAWIALRKGTKVNVGPLLQSLAAVDLLTPAVPLNGFKLKVSLSKDKPLLLYHFFYSTRPSLFK